MQRNQKGQFTRGAIPWNKGKGKPLGTIVVIKFISGLRHMIKVQYGTNHNYIKYSRWLIEKKIGRKLKNNEIVHHINGNKLDDRIENLKLEKRGEHTSHHWKGIIPIEGIKASKKYYKKRRDKFKPEIMELHNQGISLRKISQITHLNRNTVTKIIRGDN